MADWADLSTAEFPVRFAHLSRESLSQRAYEEVRAFLMRGRLKPGERLHYRGLASELGISTTPVREALLRLVSESALDMDARGTVMVPTLTADRYVELRDLRVILEGTAAERAALLATTAETDALAALHDAHLAAEAAGTFDTALELNERFHFDLCRLARLPVLFRIVEMLWVQCGPFLNHFYGQRRSVWSPARHPHGIVIRALRDGDGAAARAAIAQDILAGGEPILARLTSDDHAQEHALPARTVPRGSPVASPPLRGSGSLKGSRVSAR